MKKLIIIIFIVLCYLFLTQAQIFGQYVKPFIKYGSKGENSTEKNSLADKYATADLN